MLTSSLVKGWLSGDSCAAGGGESARRLGVSEETEEAELGSGAAADCEGQEGESWRIWSRRPAWEKEDSRTDVEGLGDVERVRRDVGEEGYKVVFERFDQTVQLQVREVRNGDGVWIENHLIQTLFGTNV